MKYNHLSLLSGIFCLLLSPVLQGQYVLDEYYQQGDLKYEDHIYKDGIRTVKLHPVGSPLEMPVLSLRGGGQLLLSFDDLFADYMNMSYSIVHCNADWTPSDLLRQEYSPGFQEAYLEEYNYSLNALIPYTNYQLRIPNKDVQILKSGNYLLKVYVTGDENDLVLTRRFMVYENRVSVGGKVKRPSRVEYMNERQEIDFVISHQDYHIQNPFSDLQVHLLQNHRWDNAITTLKPQFMRNNQLLYQYDQENTFNGGNEFRFFDLKNMQALSQNISKIDRDSVFTAYLFPDKPRSISQYAVEFDINGQYQIRRLDATNSDTEADYIYVDFLLRYPEPIKESDVYIFGRITDWKLLPEYKLKYDYTRQAYRTRILLKQGYYNYAYALFDSEEMEADVTKTEGSHWETENTYQIFVYNREVGERYDRLIGFGEVNSDDLY